MTFLQSIMLFFGLCLLGQWALLATLMERVYVASTVWTEVVEQGQGRSRAGQLQQAAWNTSGRPQLLGCRDVTGLSGRGRSRDPHSGRAGACSLVCMDALKGCQAAQAAGVRTMGVVGALLVGKQTGRIWALHPLLAQLQQQGFRLSRALVGMALRAAGEFPTPA